jgi:hypothetical protein
MRHTPGFYRRLAVIALQTDVARGGLAAVLMVALALGGLSPWLVLGLPPIAYAGLRLLPRRRGQSAERTGWQTGDLSERSAYARCLALRQEIDALSGRVEDAQARDSFRRIISRIDEINGAIAEDGKYGAARTLLELVGPTHELLVGYLKVRGRGLESGEMRERVRTNLDTLGNAYDRFWVRLNRDAVVNLEALGEAIEFTLTDLASSSPGGAMQ